MPVADPAKKLFKELDDLKSLLETDGPADIAASLVDGTPDLPVEDVERLITALREGGMPTLFKDDEELAQFRRHVGERIFARIMTLIERVLAKMGEKIDKTPIQRLSMRDLSSALDALSRQAVALSNNKGKNRHEDLSDDDLDRLIAEKKRKLLESKG